GQNGSSNGSTSYVIADEFPAISAAVTADIAYTAIFSGATNVLWGAYTPLYLQISYDGASTLKFSYSMSGYPGSWITLATQTVATYIGAITGIGICGCVAFFNSAADETIAFIDWFRRTA
ncbi:MAG: hypothetical protein ACREUG_14870, partial [Steroidobacteraceae bacterium]